MKDESVSPPMIHMIGDSTMADKDPCGRNPERGWGQLLSEFFRPGVGIANHARDGRSTKRFINEGLWEPVVAGMRKGDWIVIQFGHNDQKTDQPDLYAEAATIYRELLTRFVSESRDKGVSPILATSICRRNFSREGKLQQTLGDYPETMRFVAGDLDVPLIDLNHQTGTILAGLGPEKSKNLFLHFSPGELPFYPEGNKDDTHLSVSGARTVAALFCTSLQRQNIPLAEWLAVMAFSRNSN